MPQAVPRDALRELSDALPAVLPVVLADVARDARQALAQVVPLDVRQAVAPVVFPGAEPDVLLAAQQGVLQDAA